MILNAIPCSSSDLYNGKGGRTDQNDGRYSTCHTLEIGSLNELQGIRRGIVGGGKGWESD